MTPSRSAAYFVAATQAALVLAAFRAPYRGRSTAGERLVGLVRPRREPVLGEAGRAAGRATTSCATRWTLRRSRSAGGRATGATAKAAFYAYAHPARDGFAGADMSPGRWDAALGEYVLDWDDVRSSADPHAVALDFARSVFRHACTMCGWDPRSGRQRGGNPTAAGVELDLGW